MFLFYAEREIHCKLKALFSQQLPQLPNVLATRHGKIRTSGREFQLNYHTNIPKLNYTNCRQNTMAKTQQQLRSLKILNDLN